MRLEGDQIGPKLKELIQMPAGNQPFVHFFIKAENCTYEGLRIAPEHSSVDGKKITIGVRRLGYGESVIMYYWNEGEANEGPQEITRLEM